GHLLQVAAQVGHGLLLDAVSLLSQLWRIREGVQDGVPALYYVLREQLDRVVQLLAADRTSAPLVEALDLAFYSLPALISGILLAGGILGFHVYLAFPSSESSIWARW